MIQDIITGKITVRANYKLVGGYAGVIFGVHNPTTPNHLTAIVPSWQYTGAYIDLPPGKWIVNIYQLIVPNRADNNTIDWDGTGTDRALWVRTELSNSDTTFSYSIQIVGSWLVSGSVVAPSIYGIASGALYINNNTGVNTRYYL